MIKDIGNSVKKKAKAKLDENTLICWGGGSLSLIFLKPKKKPKKTWMPQK